MASYAAVISLKNTIDHILNSSPRLNLVHLSIKILQLSHKELQPLQEILERLDDTGTSRSRKKVDALDEQIKQTLWQFEDLLESLLSDQIISEFKSPRNQLELRRRRLLSEDQGEESNLSSPSNLSRSFSLSSPSNLSTSFNLSRSFSLSSSLRQYEEEEEESKRDGFFFSINLKRLQEDVDYFIQKLKDMEKEYIYELENMAEDDDEESISSRAYVGGMKSEMIGLSDQSAKLKSSLLLKHCRKRARILVGMAGIGKTTLAKEITENPSVLSHFECHASVTVGRKSQLNQVLRGILAQLDPNMHEIAQGDDEKVVDFLKERMEGKKCLIVVDDVWEKQLLASLISSLPDAENGIIEILVTARDRDVISTIDSKKCTTSYIMVRFLNEEESKDLLCKKVFGEEICPPQLDKAATKIAKICEGLPLTVVTIAEILSKSQNRDPEYWNEVAEKRNSVFTDAYEEISKVLFPSYGYLPQHLKMFFLFLGVFPSDYEIPESKIINMLTAEGWFLDTNKKQSLKKSVFKCLEDLVMWRNLVLSKQKSIHWWLGHAMLSLKTCRLHSSWRHLCIGEARKNKFIHVLNRLIDGLEECLKAQRCLCFHNNILFGIKQFFDSVKCNGASSTRSLLFLGPYHQYPTPIGVGFKLLREVDALKLRFYTFPTEILALVQLKYLALTCNGELPTTISKLFNLRVLIIHPHINIKHCKAPSFIPVQIWDLQELEHIEVLGKSLIAPNHAASLEKLSTLVGVNASICTISNLFKKIPHIRKLGVEIELTPSDDDSNLFNCFFCISKLGSLETLKCSIINPIKYGYAVPASLSLSPLKLPHGLKKLHLSGMGFPWKYMNVIGSLPFLEVLKLRCYAFRGPNWEPSENSFRRLEFLVIEDTDLVKWKPRSRSFPKLTYLCMKHCYKLKELHWPSRSSRRKIEIVDCNPAFTCAKRCIVTSSF